MTFRNGSRGGRKGFKLFYGASRMPLLAVEQSRVAPCGSCSVACSGACVVSGHRPAPLDTCVPGRAIVRRGRSGRAPWHGRRARRRRDGFPAAAAVNVARASRAALRRGIGSTGWRSARALDIGRRRPGSTAARVRAMTNPGAGGAGVSRRRCQGLSSRPSAPAQSRIRRCACRTPAFRPPVAAPTGSHWPRSRRAPCAAPPEPSRSAPQTRCR